MASVDVLNQVELNAYIEQMRVSYEYIFIEIDQYYRVERVPHFLDL